MSGSNNRKIVVAQLSGGNDYLNCVVPYTDPLYYDSRPLVHISEDRVIPLDDDYGLNPSMQPIKELYDQGKVAIIHGVGYPVPNRSHFRSMDVWHTAEPTTIALEGWLGNALKQIDPNGENAVTGVNFGAGLPRAMVCARSARRMCEQPRLLRPHDAYRQHRTPRTGPRGLQKHVHPGHRQRSGNGLPHADGP